MAFNNLRKFAKENIIMETAAAMDFMKALLKITLNGKNHF